MALATGLVATGIALASSEQRRHDVVESLESQLAASSAARAEAEADAADAVADLDEAVERLTKAEARLAAADIALERSDSNVRRLRRDYNSLYSDFQRLYTLAATLVGQSSSPTSYGYSPIHCTTSTISGYYVYTDCY